MVNFMM